MKDFLSLEPAHQKRVLEALKNPDKAVHLLFRILGPRFQKRFQKMTDLNSTPCVFIHGNPHLDNYARTLTGAGMVDFDRSRIGPYCWDIIRFLGSLSLMAEVPKKKRLLPSKIIDAFQDGYMSAYLNPDLYYTMPSFVKLITPSESELTTVSYMQANLKWAKRMRKNPIDHDDPKIEKMLELYSNSRHQTLLLESYKIIEAGSSVGSLGKKHYIVALAPTEKESNKDCILLDFKETYVEPDTKWFFSPTEHHGERMVKASNLYSPGVEQRLGFFTYDDKHFWAREIPSFNAKVKDLLSSEEEEELAYCVGVQLGRGHRRSNRNENFQNIEQHFLQHYEEFQGLSDHFVKRVRRQLDDVIQSEERIKKLSS